MNRLFVFLLGAVCGGAVTTGAFTSHVVRTNDAWLLVPRAGVNVKDIYVDVRNWTLSDWRAHPELARDMLKAGHAEVIKEQASDDAVEDDDRLTQRPDEPRRRPAPDDAARGDEGFDPEFAPQ